MVLFELSTGVSFYSVQNRDMTAPMIAGAIGVGGRVYGVELLGRFSYDSVVFYSTLSGTVLLGYAFR
jgi:hypothetical protein